MVLQTSKRTRNLLILLVNLLLLSHSFALVEEQAFVDADIAWCVNPDCFVDGFNSASGTAAGTVAQNAAAYQPLMCVADDNIDLTLATQSGTALTTGVFRIWAVLMDCTDEGDLTAQEVARDVA